MLMHDASGLHSSSTILHGKRDRYLERERGRERCLCASGENNSIHQ